MKLLHKQQKTTPDISIAWPARISKDGYFAINLPHLWGLPLLKMLSERGLFVW